MSGGQLFRIRLDDGTELDGPIENAQKAMQALSERGAKIVDAAPVPIGAAVFAPPELPPQPSGGGGGASGSWSPDPLEKLVQLRRDLQREIPQTLDDAAAAIKPYVMGAGGIMPDPAERARALLQSQAAVQRSPIASRVAQGAVELPLSAAAVGGAPAILSGPPLAAIDVMGRGGSDREAALAALVAGGMGGVTDASGAILRGARGLAGRVAPGLSDRADIARLKAVLPGPMVADLQRAKGAQGVARYAAELEQPREAIGGNAISSGYFSTPAGSAARAGALGRSAGARINDVTDQLAERYPTASVVDARRGPDVNVGDIATNLRNEAEDVARRTKLSANAHARYMDRTAGRIEQSSIEPVPEAQLYNGSALGDEPGRGTYYSDDPAAAAQYIALQRANGAGAHSALMNGNIEWPTPNRPYFGTIRGAAPNTAAIADEQALRFANATTSQHPPVMAGDPATRQQLMDMGADAVQFPSSRPLELNQMHDVNEFVDLSGEAVSPVGRPSSVVVTLPNRRIADPRITPIPTGNVPFERALADRRYFDRAIGDNWNQTAANARMQDLVDRGVANDYRRALGKSIEDNAPDLSAQWQTANRDAHLAALVNDPATRTASTQLGVTPGGVRDMARLVGGFSPTYAATNLAGKTLAPMAESALAQGLRSASGAAARLGTESPGALEGFLNGRAPGAIAGLQGANAQGPSPQEVSASARGWLLADAAEKIAYQNPAALGPWRQKFEQALNAPGGSQVSALLRELRETDPAFRTQLLPQLQRLTMEE